MKEIKELITSLGSNRIFSIFLLVLFLVLGLMFSDLFQRPSYHDEGHFYEVIKDYSEEPFTEVILDYPEVTPPFFYYLYAGWGGIFGMSLPSLRILSFLLSLTFLAGLFFLFSLVPVVKYWKNWLILLVIFNPYFLGSSFLIYTDILALFFLMVFLFGIYFGNQWMLFIGLALGILTRQYLVFVGLAAGLQFLWEYYRTKEIEELKKAVLLVIALLPYLALVIIWNGPAPPSGLEKWQPEGDSGYHLHYLSTYFSMIFLYLWPLLILFRFQFKWSQLIFFGLGVIWFLIFPVESSIAAQEQIGLQTVGFVHKGLLAVLGNSLTYFILMVSCGFGLAWVSELMFGVFKSRNPIKEVLALSILCFLLIMPLSYQVWEKYLLSIIPFFLLLVPISSSESIAADSSQSREG